MTDPGPKLADSLALDRTRMAAERSLMAWVRTALSMITFGFTLYKFLQYVGAQSAAALPRPHAPRNLALALIGVGTLALIVACVQHWNYVRALGVDSSRRRWDLALIVGCLIALLGLLMLASVVFGSGPFA